MITKDEFLAKYNISDEYFEDADISWDSLSKIYEDFENNKKSKYKKIMLDFQGAYLEDLSKIKVHSIRSRIKDGEHLIEKIIRKKKENYTKYKNISADNYERFLTDLIGIRCFILFKEDWEEFHNYITLNIENNTDLYISDPINDFDSNTSHNYHAEKPKVHIRSGDRVDIYEGILSDDSIKSNKIYRSVHYIIKYKGVYIEIQVRTLFEESWGEIDHAMVYPYYLNDPVMDQYTKLLNRMSGLADEMGSFFRVVKDLEAGSMNTAVQKSKETVTGQKTIDVNKEAAGNNILTKDSATPKDCLMAKMSE